MARKRTKLPDLVKDGDTGVKDPRVGYFGKKRECYCGGDGRVPCAARFGEILQE